VDSVVHNLVVTGEAVFIQVHIRTKPCYKPDVACNCAVAVREGNNVIGVYACDADKPPVAIRYLEDPEAPGAQLLISPNGKKYTVNKALRYAVKVAMVAIID